MTTKEKTLRKFQKDFVDCIVDIDPKYSKFIDEHFWDLICDNETRDLKNARRKERFDS